MKELHKRYDEMQKTYGDSSLNCIYGGGCEKEPRLCLVFMNPTKRNITSGKDWQGIRTPWLGTKDIWRFLTACNLFDEDLNAEIQSKKPIDWTAGFCEKVYAEVTRQGLYVTNLAKCNQPDARYLEDDVFKAYLPLLHKEIEFVNPHKIILFGNQVSSVVLGQKIEVSKVRGREFELKVGKKTYPTYAVYYPVGNGRFNTPKAIIDLKEIL